MKLVFFFFFFALTLEASNKTLSYQGRLTNGSGVPVSGSHQIIVCLFNNSAADYTAGGTLIDIQTAAIIPATGVANIDNNCQGFDGVTLTDGVFSVELDLTNATVQGNILTVSNAGTDIYARVYLDDE